MALTAYGLRYRSTGELLAINTTRGAIMTSDPLKAMRWLDRAVIDEQLAELNKVVSRYEICTFPAA